MQTDKYDCKHCMERQSQRETIATGKRQETVKMGDYPGYPNYGSCPPATNQQAMAYAMPPGGQQAQAHQNYPPPYSHQAFYQGMYPTNPPMFHQFPPGPPLPYYQPAQNPPNQTQFPANPAVSQHQFSQYQFVPYPTPNPAASGAVIPNAPPLEVPSVQAPTHPIDPIQSIPNKNQFPGHFQEARYEDNQEVMQSSQQQFVPILTPSPSTQTQAGSSDPISNLAVPVELEQPEIIAVTGATLAIANANDYLEQDPNKELKSAVLDSPYMEAAELMAAVTITKAIVDQKADDQKVNHGTIKPYHPFEPKKDAEALRKACKGLGTNEQAIMKILVNRTQVQRSEIASVYEAMYHRKLVKDLKSELSGNLKEISRALMMPRVRYYTKCLLVALKGHEKLLRLMVEVYFTLTNAEIHEINEIYQIEFKTSLAKDIKREAPGYLGRIMVAANYGTRDENPHVDHDKVKADAVELHKSSSGRWDKPDAAFARLLISRSYPHLRRVFKEYSKITGLSVEDALKIRMSGTLLDGMLLIVSCIQNHIEFFVKRINYAIKTLGIDDATIIRIIVTRSEIDLKLIKEAYQKRYKKSIGQHLYLNTGGDYRTVFLEILKTE